MLTILDLLLNIRVHDATDYMSYGLCNVLDSTTEMCFLIVLEVGGPRLRCEQGCFLPRPLSLACGWLSPHSVLHMAFLLCVLS